MSIGVDTKICKKLNCKEFVDIKSRHLWWCKLVWVDNDNPFAEIDPVPPDCPYRSIQLSVSNKKVKDVEINEGRRYDR